MGQKSRWSIPVQNVSEYPHHHFSLSIDILRIYWTCVLALILYMPKVFATDSVCIALILYAKSLINTHDLTKSCTRWSQMIRAYQEPCHLTNLEKTYLHDDIKPNIEKTIDNQYSKQICCKVFRLVNNTKNSTKQWKKLFNY